MGQRRAKRRGLPPVDRCEKIGYKTKQYAELTLKLIQERRAFAGDEQVECRVYLHSSGPLACGRWHLTSKEKGGARHAEQDV